MDALEKYKKELLALNVAEYINLQISDHNGRCVNLERKFPCPGILIAAIDALIEEGVSEDIFPWLERLRAISQHTAEKKSRSKSDGLFIASYVFLCFAGACAWTWIVQQVFPDRAGPLFMALCAIILCCGILVLENRIAGSVIFIGMLLMTFWTGAKEGLMLAPVYLVGYFVVPLAVRFLRVNISQQKQ